MLASIRKYLQRRSLVKKEAHRKGHIQLTLLPELKAHLSLPITPRIQQGLRKLYIPGTQVLRRVKGLKKHKQYTLPCSDFYPEKERLWCSTFDEDEPFE